MKLSAIKIDVVKAEAGIWIDNIPDFDGVRLRVRPIGNPDYRRVLSQLTSAVPRGQKRGGIVVDQEVKTTINCRVLAETVLVDWEGFEDDDGTPLKYAEPLAKQWLLDPEMAAFRDAVVWAAEVAGEELMGTAQAKTGK